MNIIETEDCAICGESINNKFSQKIECGHVYHYECIMKTFQYNKHGNYCPLCRKNGGLLPLVNGLNKLHKNIHYISQYPSDYSSTPCSVIIKSGKRKGLPCGCKCMIGYSICKRHNMSITNKTVNTVIANSNATLNA